MINRPKQKLRLNPAKTCLFAWLLLSHSLGFSQTMNGFQPQLPQVQIPQVHIPGNSQPAFNNPSANNSTQLQAYELDLQSVRNREQQMQDFRNDLKQEKFYTDYLKHLEETKHYRNAYNQLTKAFSPDSFSLIKAIYIIENAYYNNTVPYDRFLKAIQLRADLVKQILKREGLDRNNNLALNYAIQKLFSQTNTYYNPRTKQSIAVPPIKYDFEDFKGEQKYDQLFVTKALSTGKGQCHSMPLLYLCIAEVLGAKANLSLAPEHSFIQFFDDKNRRMSFECTNGNLVSENWQSGFINATALKNKIYLDTLSQRKLFAQCMADLALGYQAKFGNDNFLEQIQKTIEKIDSSNLTAKILNANLSTERALAQIKAAGSPNPQQLQQYPEAYAAYVQMMHSYATLDNTGFQEMPPEMYQAWLRSVEKEKKSRQAQELQAKMQQEINILKKAKVTFIKAKKN
jgi:hypothetical protein